jgi:hypothetical protein
MNVVRVVGGQEHRYSADVLHFADPPVRDQLQQILVGLGNLPGSAVVLREWDSAMTIREAKRPWLDYPVRLGNRVPRAAPAGAAARAWRLAQSSPSGATPPRPGRYPRGNICSYPLVYTTRMSMNNGRLALSTSRAASRASCLR